VFVVDVTARICETVRFLTDEELLRVCTILAYHHHNHCARHTRAVVCYDLNISRRGNEGVVGYFSFAIHRLRRAISLISFRCTSLPTRCTVSIDNWLATGDGIAGTTRVLRGALIPG
jgi:hypothetical protein